jgi:hypothetical protein
MAYIIDMIILGSACLMLFILLSAVNQDLIYFIPVVFVFYTVVSEILMNGQTLGKKAMRLRVINSKGKEVNSIDFIIRWAFRLIDLYLSIFSLAVVFISTSEKSQRLGGILSNTMVISLAGEMELSLEDILRIEDREQYTPVYSEAFRFSEEEMLTVKAVLDRHLKYHNDSHLELLKMAAIKCRNVLGIESTDQNDAEFLRTLLRDYIVITRS